MKKRSVFELAELYNRASVQRSEFLRSVTDSDLAAVRGGVDEGCLSDVNEATCTSVVNESAVNESCLVACNEACTSNP